MALAICRGACPDLEVRSCCLGWGWERKSQPRRRGSQPGHLTLAEPRVQCSVLGLPVWCFLALQTSECLQGERLSLLAVLTL